jgi:hypothetical protein
MTIQLRELTQAEYDATWHGLRMVDITTTATEVLDIWPYADKALNASYPHECNFNLKVNQVYESQDGCFQHVLIGTNTSNLYLAVIVNVQAQQIEGHFHLNLGQLYGLVDGNA